MAVCFWYLVKRDWDCTGATVAYTGEFTFYKVSVKHGHVYLFGLYLISYKILKGGSGGQKRKSKHARLKNTLKSVSSFPVSAAHEFFHGKIMTFFNSISVSESAGFKTNNI